MARDKVLNFGSIAAAVKATPVYSADVIDFGTIDSRSPTQTHRTGEQHDLSVIFNAPVALASGDYVDNFKLQHSDSDSSGFVDLIVGPACPAAAPAGKICVLPMPKKHKRYVRAGCTPQSSGTFTAIALGAWLEPGPNILD